MSVYQRYEKSVAISASDRSSYSKKGKKKIHRNAFLYIKKAFSFGGGRVGRLQAAVLNILGSYSQPLSHMNSGVYLLNEVWALGCLVANGH